MRVKVLTDKKYRSGLKQATIRVTGGKFVARAFRCQIHNGETGGVRSEAIFEVIPSGRFQSHLLDRREERVNHPSNRFFRRKDWCLVISKKPFSVVQHKIGNGLRSREEFAAQPATPALLRQWGILHPLIKPLSQSRS